MKSTNPSSTDKNIEIARSDACHDRGRTLVHPLWCVWVFSGLSFHLLKKNKKWYLNEVNVNVDFGYGKVNSAKKLRLIIMFLGKSKIVYRLKIKKLNYVNNYV
jgi:hypothetical protein